MIQKPVIGMNYGLYYDRGPLSIPARGLQDGMNFRIYNGVISSHSLGWVKFSDNWQLDESVMKIDNFLPPAAEEKLIFIDLKNIYLYDPSGDSVSYLNVQYDTGTVEVSTSTVTGTGTTWTTNAEAGDMIHFGDADFNDPEGLWYTIDSVGGDTSITLVEDAGTIMAGTAYTIRRLLHGTRANKWSTAVFINDGTSGDSLWFATNGIDDVLTWNGTDATVTAHPELGFTCKSVIAFKNMMIYMNVIYRGDTLPNNIINSDVGFPLLAGDTGTGLSEQFQVHDGQDEILGAHRLGDTLVIYSERHIIPIQFVGDPLVFTFRDAATDTGPLSVDSVAEFGDYHELITKDNMVRFDGVTLTDINMHVMREAIRTIDPTRITTVFHHFNEERGEVYWSIPSTTDTGAGDIANQSEVSWTEHYLEPVGDAPTPFSKRAFPFTAAGYYSRSQAITWADMTLPWTAYTVPWNDQFFSLAFPITLVGDDEGFIYVLNDSQLGNGAMLPSYVRTGRKPTMPIDRWGRGLVRRCTPYCTVISGDFQVSLYGCENPHGTATLKETKTISGTLPEDGNFASFMRRARYIEWQFGSTGAGYELEGFHDDIDLGGER